jgi:hypothetical protein
MDQRITKNSNQYRTRRFRGGNDSPQWKKTSKGASLRHGKVSLPRLFGQRPRRSVTTVGYDEWTTADHFGDGDDDYDDVPLLDDIYIYDEEES